MQRAVTLEDLATATGCSTATVSLALRNKPGVSRSTRERVLAVAQSLGYQGISRPASSDTQTSLDVAVIFRSWSGDMQARAPVVTGFYSWVLTGLQESAVVQGSNLLLATIPVDAGNNPTVFPQSLLEKDLDGIILTGSFQKPTIDCVARSSARNRTPIVQVDPGDGHRDFDSVETANGEGAATATRYLIDRGHRRIGWFGPSSEFEPNYCARRDGYLAALSGAELDSVGVFEAGVDSFDALAAANMALRDADSPTAFVCSNDIFALALVRAARQAGRSVPEDLSVVGFDDIDQSRDAEPPLTTMAVDKLGLGRHAMYALVSRVTWPESPPVRIILRPTLIERASVRTI